MLINQLGLGAALNFEVVGGTTAPAAPKENTIWVNTDTAITSYVFATDAPTSPAEGMVWLTTATSSPTAFNAIKKNGLWVYPSAAQQYIDGKWQTKTAKTWQGGEWRQCTNAITLFDYGAAVSVSWEKSSLVTIESTIAFAPTQDSRYQNAFVSTPIDMADMTTLSMVIYGNWTAGTGGTTLRIGVSGQIFWDSYSEYIAYVDNVAPGTSASKTINLDVSGLSGKYYVGISAFLGGGNSDRWYNGGVRYAKIKGGTT